MSEEERNSLEEGSFEVEELDESQLEGISGGDNTCTINESQCISTSGPEGVVLPPHRQA